MNATQTVTAPVAEALYVSTSPANVAVEFFTSKQWKITTVHNLQELNEHLPKLKQPGERKLPLVVLFGRLDELDQPPEGLNARALVARIAAEAGEIRGLIPLAPISSHNAELFDWSTEEKQQLGLGKLQIISFGSDRDRPLRVFAGMKQEGAYSDLALILGLTTPPRKEGGRG